MNQDLLGYGCIPSCAFAVNSAAAAAAAAAAAGDDHKIMTNNCNLFACVRTCAFAAKLAAIAGGRARIGGGTFQCFSASGTWGSANSLSKYLS